MSRFVTTTTGHDPTKSTRQNRHTGIARIIHMLMALTVAAIAWRPAAAQALDMMMSADGTRVTGTCSSVLKRAIGGTGQNSTQFTISLPDGQKLVGYCWNSYFAKPDHNNHSQPGTDTYTFTATKNANGTWAVRVHSENSTYTNSWNNDGSLKNGKVTRAQNPSAFTTTRQSLWIPSWNIRWSGIALTKKSSDPSLTNGNPSYPMAGTAYMVYRSNGTTRSGVYIYVNSAGKGSMKLYDSKTSPSASDKPGYLGPGTFVVREWKVAPGSLWQKDTTSHKVTLAAAQTLSLTVYEKPGSGKAALQLEKVSSNPDVTNDNPCYSLKGAEYTVYSNEACTKSVGILVTDEEGVTNELELAAGTYWARETHAPLGYATDTRKHVVVVNAAGRCTVDGSAECVVEETPIGNPVDVAVVKVDADSRRATPQGGATLSGAEFVVSYYDGYYADASALPDQPKRFWVLQTDEAGYARLGEQYVDSGDDLYLDANGSPILPLGTVTIRETRAPLGYRLPEGDNLWLQQIRAESNKSATINAFAVPTEGSPTVADEVIRGGLKLRKTDALTGEGLAGARFAIVNDNEGEVLVDGRSYARGETCMSIESAEDGVAATAPDALPVGDYIVREEAAPTGYLRDEEWSKSVHIGLVEVQPDVVDVDPEEPQGDGTEPGEHTDDGSGTDGEGDAAGEGTVAEDGSDYMGDGSNSEDGSDYSGDGMGTEGEDDPTGGGDGSGEPDPAPGDEDPDDPGEDFDGQDTSDRQVSYVGEMMDLTGEPLPNPPLSTSVSLEATKRFDGSARDLALEEGMFSFELLDEDGTRLQLQTNDGQGRIAFDPIAYDWTQAGEQFRYVMREVAGDDEAIVYDDHREEVLVSVTANEDGTLSASVEYDSDGAIFENRATPPISFPETGKGGVRGAGSAAAASLVSTVLLRARRRRPTGEA